MFYSLTKVQASEGLKWDSKVTKEAYEKKTQVIQKLIFSLVK